MLMMKKSGIGNNCMWKTGRVAFILLLLFLLATFATAFHHHDDDCLHHDCPVCAAGHHISSSGFSSFPLGVHQTVSDYETPQEPLLYNCLRLTLLPCRAPPA
jgi:hypothetical protein